MKLFVNFRREEDFWFLDKFKDKPFTFFYDYLPKNRDELNINPYNLILFIMFEVNLSFAQNRQTHELL